MNSLMATKEAIALGGMTIQFLVEGEESNGSVSVFRCDMPPGGRPAAPHSHDAFEETVYGLKGEITWTVDGEPTVIGPGDVVLIPRGAVHGFEVSGDEDASMLCIASPGIFGPAYFREMAAVLAAGGPPDVQALMAVMKRHGLTPVAP
jgi:quercetin dioxygenase-like cupin family protein